MESEPGQSLGGVLGEGNSDPRSAPLPALGEGGRASPGAQAQPSCKIILHIFLLCFSWCDENAVVVIIPRPVL